jgi:hypothetical protein
MADASRHDFNEHFSGARAFKIDFNDFKGRVWGKSNGSAGLHGYPL